MNLPPELIVTHYIKRGAILHSTMFDYIDHGKFFVIIGISKDTVAGFFFINSNIHHYIIGKESLLEMQFLLSPSDYTFLTHESFLSATNIIQRPLSVIAESIQKGDTVYIGELSEEHLSEVLRMARGSKLFSKKEKKQFLY